MTFVQCRINVCDMSWRCINVNVTLYKRHILCPLGILDWLLAQLFPATHKLVGINDLSSLQSDSQHSYSLLHVKLLAPTIYPVYDQHSYSLYTCWHQRFIQFTISTVIPCTLVGIYDLSSLQSAQLFPVHLLASTIYPFTIE